MAQSTVVTVTCRPQRIYPLDVIVAFGRDDGTGDGVDVRLYNPGRESVHRLTEYINGRRWPVGSGVKVTPTGWLFVRACPGDEVDQDSGH